MHELTEAEVQEVWRTVREDVRRFAIDLANGKPVEIVLNVVRDMMMTRAFCKLGKPAPYWSDDDTSRTLPVVKDAIPRGIHE